jgi:hypothetical protein
MNSTAFSLSANNSAEFDGSQEVELTIGSLSILIGTSGSSRLSDSTKPNLLANMPEAEAMLESSEGSSSEVNSLVSSGKTPIEKDDKIQEKFDLEERVHDSPRDFVVGSNGVSKVHQLCVIITEAEEENSNEGSKKVNMQVNKAKEHKKEKEKVHVSAGEWRMIKSAINHGTEVPEG